MKMTVWFFVPPFQAVHDRFRPIMLSRPRFDPACPEASDFSSHNTSETAATDTFNRHAIWGHDNP
jgi:hypothetical protein